MINIKVYITVKKLIGWQLFKTINFNILLAGC